MSDLKTTEMRLGGRVWWDGTFWELSELGDGRATLRRSGRTASVSINRLAQLMIDAGPPADHDDEDETESLADSALRLSMVSKSERARVERLAGVIVDLLADEQSALHQRVEAAAKRLGVSSRTLHRRIADYRRAGVAGLVDSRATRRRASRVDPRWEDACRRALASYTTASTPTRAAVIARVATLLEQEYGEGTVPLPHETTAYRKLNELSKGKYTFGGAKGRRSVAERPDGAFGRLRADRPGQFVVLDTYDLDVFAMEPITCRWVKVQLTIAMDQLSPR